MDDHKEINEQTEGTTAQSNTDQANTDQATNKTSFQSSNKQGLLGLGLVGIGLLAVLTNVGDESGFLWTGMISAVMFFAYYRTKAYGLLIPACILAGVTAGIILELISPVDGVFLLGLGTGFVAIDRIEQHKTRWPLYPGIILLAIGTVITVQTLFNNMLFALMLIIVGAFLLLRNREVLDSMVDIKADVDIRFGEEAAKKESTKTFANAKSSTNDIKAKDLKAKDLKAKDVAKENTSQDSASQDSASENTSPNKSEAKTVVVDIMSEDAVENKAKEVKVVDIDLNASSDNTSDRSTDNTSDRASHDVADEVIEIEAKATDKTTDANVKDLDEAVSSIKKAVDKIVEDANLPKDDGQL